jgi:hypothetical protein
LLGNNEVATLKEWNSVLPCLHSILLDNNPLRNIPFLWTVLPSCQLLTKWKTNSGWSIFNPKIKGLLWGILFISTSKFLLYNSAKSVFWYMTIEKYCIVQKTFFFNTLQVFFLSIRGGGRISYQQYA